MTAFAFSRWSSSTARASTDTFCPAACSQSKSYQGLAIIHHARGDAAESDAAIRELVEKHSAESAWQIATAYAGRGEADATFEWLERCWAQRDSGLALIKPSFYFRWLRSDPRWEPFMRKIGLWEDSTAASIADPAASRAAPR
jgi:hypothetical protein